MNVGIVLHSAREVIKICGRITFNLNEGGANIRLHVSTILASAFRHRVQISWMNI